MCGDIEEAAVGRKALIKAIANFIQVVLSDNTLALKVGLPKSESSDFGTQTTPTPPLIQRSPSLLVLPSTSIADEDIFEKETSPVITRIVGATAEMMICRTP